MGLEVLRKIAATAKYIVFDTYDRLETQSLLDRVALVFDNTVLLENPMNVVWLGGSLKLREWLGERESQKLLKGEYFVEDKKWEMTVEFDEIEFQRPESVIKAEELLRKMARDFQRGKLKLAMDVIRQNPKAHDGKPLFHSAHKHLDGKSYSNVIPLPFANVLDPTLEEMSDFVHEAFGRLVENGAVDDEAVDMERFGRDLVVIVHHPKVAVTANKLRTKDRIGASDNELKGTFGLIYDTGGAMSGSIEVIYSETTAPARVSTNASGEIRVGAPRPIFYKVSYEPKDVESNEGSLFKDGTLQLGLKAYYNAVPGAPQVIVQGIEGQG